MMDRVFYQGETIPIVVVGDEHSELLGMDFTVLVYPQYDRRQVIELGKRGFTSEVVDGELRYRSSITHEETRDLPVGDYAIELMVAEWDGYRSVYQQMRAFSIRFSNAKNII